MTGKNELTVFENFNIRRIYDEKLEVWFFSVVDIVAALIQQPDHQAARNYWKVLRNRLNKEGSETVTKCNRLKMMAADGKMRLTDVADPETILRLIQSVPSPKAEPIKIWLARVGYERMQDMADPARSLDRAREFWRQHGRSEKWIQQRMTGQETRNKLTDYWQTHEITKEEEFAILTGIIHQEWSGVSVKKHKDLKKIKTQNLRDHMSEAELIFTALAELSTRQIAESVNATGIKENKEAGKKGGGIAGDARRQKVILHQRPILHPLSHLTVTYNLTYVPYISPGRFSTPKPGKRSARPAASPLPPPSRPARTAGCVSGEVKGRFSACRAGGGRIP